jgi:D-alanyl-lipoteichoic acid acyltransferase DltB (MBOAT superfamily)
MRYQRLSNYFLIAVSYGLYLKWKPVYAFVLLSVTAVTYLVALKIEKDNAYGKKKYLIFGGICLAALPLLIFKYYNFLNSSIESAFAEIGLSLGLPGLNWIMPLGISFFTLQAVGYLADVYLQRIKAEHNWWDYMLFVSFFPQIASGPISKAADLLPQIKAERCFNEAQFVQGLKWILWGMFLKVVVADHLALNVNDAYIHLMTNSGLTLFMASIFYSMQIYCDFAGYSFMAVGVGELLGFELVNNFRRPYFSQTITEFWRRWHISLSTWLKDYIYIPLGGSRCSKAKNYWNIIITFLVSGLWHGANWTFVAWGGMHGLFQIVEKHLGLNKKNSSGVTKWGRICCTFMVANFAWIFFRMPTFEDAFYVIKKIFTDFTDSISSWSACLVLSAIVIFKDLMDEYNVESLRLLHSKYLLVRWGTYLFLIFSIMVFGVYGGQFIYSGF